MLFSATSDHSLGATAGPCFFHSYHRLQADAFRGLALIAAARRVLAEAILSASPRSPLLKRIIPKVHMIPGGVLQLLCMCLQYVMMLGSSASCSRLTGSELPGSVSG